MCNGKSLNGRPMRERIFVRWKLLFEGGIESPQSRRNIHAVLKMIKTIVVTCILLILVLANFGCIAIQQFMQIRPAFSFIARLLPCNCVGTVCGERAEMEESKR